MFSTVASLTAEMASISSGAWAIMGLAPTARARLAQSLAVTILLTQWIRGRWRRTLSRRVKSSMEGPFLSWDQCSNAARMDLRAPLFWRVNTRMPARMEPPTVETRKGTT